MEESEPERKRARTHEATAGGSRSEDEDEDDEDYVPYVPLRQRRQLLVRGLIPGAMATGPGPSAGGGIWEAVAVPLGRGSEENQGLVNLSSGQT